MDQVHVIRHKVLPRRGKSVRSVAKELGVSRNTVGQVPQEPRAQGGGRRTSKRVPL